MARASAGRTTSRATRASCFRGSLGYFFDRVQGDSVFGQSGNPPTGEQSTVYYSTLQSLAAGGQVLHAPPSMLVYYYDAKIGSSLNWNGGVQMVLPWSSSLDVSYVGSHNFNSVAFGAIPNAMPGELSMDLNAPDIGTAYLAAVPGPDAGHEHHPRRDRATRRTCCVRIAASARSTRPGRCTGRTMIRCRWPSTGDSATAGRPASRTRTASGTKAIPGRRSTSCTTAARSRSGPSRRRTTRS